MQTIHNIWTFQKNSMKKYSKDYLNTGKNIFNNIRTADFLGMLQDNINSQDLKELDTVEAYTKAYNIFEYASKDAKTKLEIEIIENRLQTTLLYITRKFELSLGVEITRSQFVKYLITEKKRDKEKRKENWLEDNNFIIADKKNHFDKLNAKFICEIIGEDLGRDVVDFVVDYYNNNENKSKEQQNKVAYLKNKIKKQYNYLID